MFESNYMVYFFVMVSFFFPLVCAFIFINTRAVNGYVLFHVEGAARCFFGKCNGSFFDAGELIKHLQYEHNITRGSIALFKKRHVRVKKSVTDFYFYGSLCTLTLLLIVWSCHIYDHLQVPDIDTFQTMKPDEVYTDIELNIRLAKGTVSDGTSITFLKKHDASQLMNWRLQTIQAVCQEIERTEAPDKIVDYGKYVALNLLLLPCSFLPVEPQMNFSVANSGKIQYTFYTPGLYVGCVKYRHYIQCVHTAMVDVLVLNTNTDDSI